MKQKKKGKNNSLLTCRKPYLLGAKNLKSWPQHYKNTTAPSKQTA